MQDLFKVIRIFDTRQLPVVFKTLADFQSIPDILSAASEWQICLHLTPKSGLMTSSHLLACSVGQATKIGSASEGLHRRPAVASMECGYGALLLQAWVGHCNRYIPIRQPTG